MELKKTIFEYDNYRLFLRDYYEYVDIIGFEILDSGKRADFGILSRSSYVRIIGNHVHQIRTPGCVGGGIWHGIYDFAAIPHDSEIIGNLVEDIGPALPHGLPGSSYCGTSIAISMRQPRGRVHNNIVHDAMAGIESYEAATGLSITNNLIFRACLKSA